MTMQALPSATRIAAECVTQVAYSSPPWLQVIQATGSVATAIGVLIALYIAVIRDPRKASAEDEHRVARIEALHRATTQRFGAQARKLVPSCARTPMLGDSWWAVRIDNASNGVTTLLDVNVAAIDDKGVEVPHGCSRAFNVMPVDPVVDRSIRSALSESLESALDRPLTDVVRQAIRDAVAVHFVNEWPRSLPPYHHAVMCYTTTDPGYRLRVTIDYEDEAGFQWRRTDTHQPRRTDDMDIDSITTNSPW
jgi:hypothetical protein